MKRCKDCLYSDDEGDSVISNKRCNKQNKLILFDFKANTCKYYKTKYIILDYHFINNPYEDVYCHITSLDDTSNTIMIWSKKYKILNHVLKKDCLSKEQVIELCSFDSQKEELKMKLK